MIDAMGASCAAAQKNGEHFSVLGQEARAIRIWNSKGVLPEDPEPGSHRTLLRDWSLLVPLNLGLLNQSLNPIFSLRVAFIDFT